MLKTGSQGQSLQQIFIWVKGWWIMGCIQVFRVHMRNAGLRKKWSPLAYHYYRKIWKCELGESECSSVGERCSLNQMHFWSHSKGYGTTKPQLRYTRYWSCIDCSPESPLHRKPFLRHSRMPFLSVFDLQKWTDRKAHFYHLNRATHSRTCTRDSKNLLLRRKTKAFLLLNNIK